MLFRFTAVVTMILLIGREARSQESLQDVLLAREKGLVEAIKQKDQSTLQAMLADEAYSVTVGGGRQTGSQTIDNLKAMTIDSYSISDVKTVKVSDRVGILTYKYTWSGSFKGTPVPKMSVFATSTWALRNGKWRSIFYQETPIANQSP